MTIISKLKKQIINAFSLTAVCILLTACTIYNTNTVSADNLKSTKARLDYSIAVLPFTHIGTDNEFFATGLQEDVTNHLAKIGDISVISRASVRQYADTKPSIKDVADSLLG